MQIPLQFGPLKVRVPGYAASLVQPLLRASELGEDLGPIAKAITHTFGFQVFAQGVIMSPRPEAETQAYLFSTHTLAWVQTCDQRAYIEVDPRVQAVLETPVPVIWDQRTFRGKSAATDRFLDAAQSYGIASGVAIPIHDSRNHASMMA